ncbi:MAG: ATP-binding protein, partial [Muribaculaceae bacterium]|nr:ATP-binding protein [Muribaculaceae bacterium]
VSDSAHTIARMIQNIIGGEVLINRDYGKLMSGGKFKFVSKNGSSFNLKGAATGIISFSYILQLLQHGWINEDSILIIDEPESHLHPQWVVEYARVLVMIHKLIGTKIVISSHNPDMVSAIESITRKEALEKTTRFYLSEKVEDSDGLYSFRDLGFEISEIFDSFNIALDRIVFYGGS